MQSSQPSLFPEAAPYPEGLVYRPDYVSPQEEAALAAEIARLPLAPFQFHGFEGKRRTVSFGLHYGFDGSGLRESDPMPAWLLPLRDRAATLANVEAAALRHALLIEYPPGAGIGWHRDRPVFGDVVGMSLLTPAPIRFRRKAAAKWERFTLAAAPRSAYLLTGPARHEWEHSITAVDALRYSITFRTLREPG